MPGCAGYRCTGDQYAGWSGAATNIGLEFETPLAEAVLDRLLQDHQQLPEAAIRELRDIAVRTHRLAASQPDADIQLLAELSNRCAIEAVIESLRLTEAGQAGSGEAKPS